MALEHWRFNPHVVKRGHQLQPVMLFMASADGKGLKIFSRFLSSYTIKCKWKGAHKGQQYRPGIGVFHWFTNAMPKAKHWSSRGPQNPVRGIRQ